MTSLRRPVFVLLMVLSLLAPAACSSEDETATAEPGGTTKPGPAALQSADEYFRQGNDFYGRGDFTQAEAAYQQAIELDANRPDVYTNLGVTYYSMGRLDDAIKSYQAGLALAPNDAELNYLLGAAYLQQNRLDEAAEALSKANRANPGLAEPYYGLGVLYRLQGETEKAIAAFETFLEIGPSQDPQAINEARRELEALRAGQP